jgi:hypothetical protein
MDPGILPYTKANSLVTDGEHDFYQVLRRVVDDRWTISLKVRLEDLALVPEGTPGRYKYRNYVRASHVDFLLYTTDTASPVLAIELDDSSHNNPVAQRRDAQKDAILASAGIPLLRVPWQSSYNSNLLASDINAKLPGFIPPAPTYSPRSTTYTPPPWINSPARENQRRSSRRPRRRLGPRAKFELIRASFLLLVSVVLLYGAFTGGLNGIVRSALTSLVPTRSATTVSPTPAPAVTALPLTNDATPVPDLPGITATVDTTGLNLRSGPGTDYPSLGTYPKGTQLQAFGKDPTTTWLQVRHPSGAAGWMSIRFLKLSAPLESVPFAATP